MNDGGVVALAGFLYQLVGSTHQLIQAPEDNAILALEPQGEDAGLTSSARNEIIQFKYSSVSDEISPGTLAEILETFRDNTSATPEKRWKLVTNRKLSLAAAQLYSDEYDGMLPKNVAEKNAAAIQKHRNQLDIEFVSFSEAEGAIREFGKTFGLRDDEINTGAARILAHAMARIRDLGGAATITRTELVDFLAGFEGPRSLDARHMCAHTVAQLEQSHHRSISQSKLEDALPRDALAKICSYSGNPIIVIGNGGTGKSTAVLHAVRAHMIANGALGMVLLSNAADSPTVEGLIAGWRSENRFLPPEKVRPSLERLYAANASATGSFLFIVLDGVEEFSWRNGMKRDSAEGLVSELQNLRERVAPKVIITCRTLSEARYLTRIAGFDELKRTSDNVFVVDNFDNSELLKIWLRWFPELPPPSLYQRQPTAVATVESEGQPLTDFDDRLELLRNPVVLRCFKKLFDTNPELASSMLRGDKEAFRSLIELYLEWFANKALERSGLMEKHTRKALSVVAARAVKDTVLGYKTDWVDPISVSEWLSSAEAKILFEDAHTCGLINSTQAEEGRMARASNDFNGWRWVSRHVREYLGQLA